MVYGLKWKHNYCYNNMCVFNTTLMFNENNMLDIRWNIT